MGTIDAAVRHAGWLPAAKPSMSSYFHHTQPTHPLRPPTPALPLPLPPATCLPVCPPAVTGKLNPGLTSWDALRAALPAGTVSGAPKVRAMQIIDELEVARRGPYGGGIGHVSFTGGQAGWGQRGGSGGNAAGCTGRAATVPVAASCACFSLGS